MKVGILTFHNTLNYGAQLQALALQDSIRSLGHDVEIINYINPAVAKREAILVPHFKDLLKSPRSCLGAFNSYRRFSRRHTEFERFADSSLRIGPQVDDQTGMSLRYDAVVVGSDQVWNTRLTQGDMTYFLNDPSCSGIKKVSYAASFGTAALSTADAERISPALRRFNSLSVRESAGVAVIRELTGLDAQLVLDPTLLVERSYWEGLAAPASVSAKPYVFVYTVAEKEKTIAFGKRAAEVLGAEIKIIGPSNPLKLLGMKTYNDASIEQFLALIRDARLIVTSSFHGLALALALGVDVCFSLSGSKGNGNSRLESLATIAGIESRNISMGIPTESIDYGQVDERLSRQRSVSMTFLERALSENE